MGKIRCIGILTSGGDAPGMNAAIRAVTRSGISNGYKIKGIYRGYEGLINDDVQLLRQRTLVASYSAVAQSSAPLVAKNLLLQKGARKPMTLL